jgi:hypothetical protein
MSGSKPATKYEMEIMISVIISSTFAVNGPDSLFPNNFVHNVCVARIPRLLNGKDDGKGMQT